MIVPQTVPHVFSVTKQTATTTTHITMNAAPSTINTALHNRDQAARDYVRQSLIAGRCLSEFVKPNLQHGDWRVWIESNTNYSNVRQASADVKLYESFKPYLLHTDDEVLFVSNLPMQLVNLAMDTVRILIAESTPDLALDIAFDLWKISSDAAPRNSASARQLVSAAKTIEGIADADDKQYTIDVVKKWGVTNEDVIKKLPEVRHHRDLSETVLLSGTLTLDSGADTKQLQINRASATDVNLAIGETETEKLYTDIRNRVDKANAIKSFEYITTVEDDSIDGIMESIRSVLMKASRDGATYKASLHIRK